MYEAEIAFSEGNYPIGSLIANSSGSVLSKKRNQLETENDITAHPEMLNLKEVGARTIKHEKGFVLFSSLEPCFGCSFFIDRSNIVQIYTALKDPHTT